jgi:membrane associated rhomboid family serine protease
MTLALILAFLAIIGLASGLNSIALGLALIGIAVTGIVAVWNDDRRRARRRWR